IAGNGTYAVKFYINDVLIVPVSDTIVVPVGQTRAIMISRVIPLRANDVVSIKTVGLLTDISINTVVSLRDETPILKAELFGDGLIPVDHNYDGINNLAYQTVNGSGVVGATVLVYKTSDYLIGNFSPTYIVGRTITGSGGIWVNPIL